MPKRRSRAFFIILPWPDGETGIPARPERFVGRARTPVSPSI